MTQDESDKAVADFLARGGKIQYIEAGVRSAPPTYSMWGKKKKVADPVEEVVEEVVVEEVVEEVDDDVVVFVDDEVEEESEE